MEGDFSNRFLATFPTRPISQNPLVQSKKAPSSWEIFSLPCPTLIDCIGQDAPNRTQETGSWKRRIGGGKVRLDWVSGLEEGEYGGADWCLILADEMSYFQVLLQETWILRKKEAQYSSFVKWRKRPALSGQEDAGRTAARRAEDRNKRNRNRNRHSPVGSGGKSITICFV
ncbi:uncharacterized protein N7473_006041 [Penicillium subrubescens]|uniref:uncharacterized protein n=1 Tax=Penicillium subrubescens TaxID=1316194 RepID=UPI00254521E4|nr:uncharacterized protein N7473_006041 [Penicillium subrubescens]KAJ5896642.1 hypothetical protein N7473_006041 [Penicillium subrubescens]